MNYYKFNKFDLLWVLMIIGSAIGAGVLFLPIILGSAGIYPLFIFYFFILFVNTHSHKLLSLLFLEGDVKQIYEKTFGSKISLFLYFLYILPIFFTTVFLSMSFIGTVEYLFNDSFSKIDRRFLIVFASLIMVLLSVWKLDVVKIINKYLVFLMCVCILLFSIMLVFYIDVDSDVLILQDLKLSCLTFFKSFPVALYGFSYLPLARIFSKDVLSHYKDVDIAKYKIKQITNYSNIVLVTLIMFFALCCILATNLKELESIRSMNISIVSYFAKKYDNIMMSFIIPLITSSAILTSFFSYYISTINNLSDLFVLKNKRYIHKIIVHIMVFLMLCLFSYYNPNILKFIGKISGPLIVVVGIFVPMIIIYKNKSFMDIRSYLKDIFLIAIVFFVLACSFIL